MTAPAGWQQPPRTPPKTKTHGLLAAVLTVGFLLLAVAGTFGWLYLRTNADQGTPFSSAPLPERCDSINRDTLKQMRVTNPDAKMSSHVAGPDSYATVCMWGQTLGQDGSGKRSLNVWIRQYNDQKLAEQEISAFEGSGNTVEKTDGGGALTVGRGGSAFTTVSYAVRSGGRYVRIDYSGWDAGLLSMKQPNVDEWKKQVVQVAAEVLAKS